MLKSNMRDMEILNPYHKFWNAFCFRLSDALFSRCYKGSCSNELNEIKGCDHTFKNTIKIIKTLPNIDREKTLKFFRETNAVCDCKILSNVDSVKLKDMKKILEKIL